MTYWTRSHRLRVVLFTAILTVTGGKTQAVPELLHRVIEAHGGQERFDARERVASDLRLGGLAFPLRFQRGALADYTGTVSTREPRVTDSTARRPFSDAARSRSVTGTRSSSTSAS